GRTVTDLTTARFCAPLGFCAPCQPLLLGVLLAFRHEAPLRGAPERLPVRAHGFGCAGFPLAFGQEARFRRAGQWPTVLADCSAVAALLRQHSPDRECCDQYRKCYSFHFGFSFEVV